LKRKFVEFCTEFCPVTELKKPDDLFMVLEQLTPPEDEFKLLSVASTTPVQPIST